MKTQNDNENPWQRLRASVSRFSTQSLSIFPACYEHDKDELENKIAATKRKIFSIQANNQEAVTGLMALGKKSDKPENLTPLEYFKRELKKSGDSNEKF